MINIFKKDLMHVGEMASGVKLTVPVYSYKPEASTAPNVYIQANMHGAEVQGNAVIFQLLELLKYCEIEANITLVPYANPIGCNHKNGEYTLGRFDPITGENWNRMYHFDEAIISPFVEGHIDASEAEIQTDFEQLLPTIQTKVVEKLVHFPYLNDMHTWLEILFENEIHFYR